MKNKSNEKIVVIGGTGLIGSKVISNLTEHGFTAVAASPDTGVNTLTGEGLADVLKGASVVVDVSNSPSFEDDAAMDFFTRSTGNLLKFEAEAGVKHHVALSVVGVERMSDVGYYRAKLAQETLIRESTIPYSILHATQFFEFTKGIADSAADGNEVRLAPILIQPIAADDVAREVARVAVGEPINGIEEISGPEVFKISDFVQDGLRARNDEREVVSDPNARFFGAFLSERELLPGKEAHVAETRFADWLAASSAAPPARRSETAAAGSPK